MNRPVTRCTPSPPSPVTCPATASIDPFLLQRYLNHRDIHSFPTRRSSDLFDMVTGVSSGALMAPFVFLGREHDDRLQRSEEHTSELQSHVNLVCRLLLEKKKTPIWHALASLPQTPDLHSTVQ